MPAQSRACGLACRLRTRRAPKKRSKGRSHNAGCDGKREAAHGVHLDGGGRAALGRHAAARSELLRPGAHCRCRALWPLMAHPQGGVQAPRPAPCASRRPGRRGCEPPHRRLGRHVCPQSHAPHEYRLQPRLRPCGCGVVRQGGSARYRPSRACVLSRRGRAGRRAGWPLPRLREAGCAPVRLSHLRLCQPAPGSHRSGSSGAGRGARRTDPGISGKSASARGRGLRGPDRKRAAPSAPPTTRPMQER